MLMTTGDREAPRSASAGRGQQNLMSSPAVSMYAALLRAALDELSDVPAPDDRDACFAEVLQRRRELALDVPPELQTTDAVPVVLARQVGYDVSLIRLAACLGMETDLARFGPAGHERTRLEEQFRDLGLGVGPAAWSAPYGSV